MWIFKWAVATVRSCSQGLRKQRFLSTWVMQSVLFLNCDSLWLDVGTFSLACETHHKFLALLQQTAICKLWWSDQNYYCAEYILWVLSLASRRVCVPGPPPAPGTYWVLTCYTDSYLGLWGLTHTMDLRRSTTQNYLFMTGSKFAGWLQHTALHSHMELLFCLKVRKSNFGLHLQSEMNGAPAVAAWCLALKICQSRFRHFCME